MLRIIAKRSHTRQSFFQISSDRYSDMETLVQATKVQTIATHIRTIRTLKSKGNQTTDLKLICYKRSLHLESIGHEIQVSHSFKKT